MCPINQSRREKCLDLIIVVVAAVSSSLCSISRIGHPRPFSLIIYNLASLLWVPLCHFARAGAI